MLLDNALALKIVEHWNTVVSPQEKPLRFIMRALGGYNTITSPRCRVRVPDNSDFVDCGEPTIRGDLCGEHLKRAIFVTEENLLRAERLKDAFRRRLQGLKGEAPWTNGDDCSGVRWPSSWDEAG
jgi:hypothetical protein